jgi:hypothetical protein
MADYNVYFFVVRPTLVPEHVGSSGESTTLADDAPEVLQARVDVLAIFTQTLQELFTAALEYIPGTHPPDTVNIVEIPQVSPGVPNFSGLTIAMHEPIVYLTRKEAETNPTDPMDRRPCLVMLRALQDGSFQEFPTENVRAWRDGITGGSSDLEGQAIHIGDLAPAVAEAFSNARMQYDADNWKTIQGNLLARAAYHEIAHCKAECANRAHGSHWQNAIGGSIHDESGVTVLNSPLAWNAVQSTADKQLMGRHMMCPIAFYKLDQDIAPQCFHNGRLTPPTPR